MGGSPPEERFLRRGHHARPVQVGEDKGSRHIFCTPRKSLAIPRGAVGGEEVRCLDDTMRYFVEARVGRGGEEVGRGFGAQTVLLVRDTLRFRPRGLEKSRDSATSLVPALLL